MSLQYTLPPDLALALKIGLIAGLSLIGLGVTLFATDREYGWEPVKLVGWGGVILVLAGAPWVSVGGDAALATAVAFLVAFGIGLVQFTRLWDQSTRTQ